MSKRIIDIYYDVVNDCHRDSSGKQIQPSQYPRIYLQENPLLRIRLITDGEQGIYSAFANSGLTFEASVDNDYNHTTAPMCQTSNSGINQVGDWPSSGTVALPSFGQFSIQLDANTIEFETKVGTTVEATGTMLELKVFSGSDLAGLIRFPLRAFNLITIAGGLTPRALTGLNYRYKDGNELQLKDIVTGEYATPVYANGVLGRGPMEA